MGWRWFSRRGGNLGEPPDYYREGVRLANEGKYHEALTSFRLALRQTPSDPEIMQQMAAVYTHIGMPDEAVRFYEETIQTGLDSPAAHYGLAFLMLKRGDVDEARQHLEAFLARPPEGEGAVAHIEHARRTLEQLNAGWSLEGEVDDRAGG